MNGRPSCWKTTSWPNWNFSIPGYSPCPLPAQVPISHARRAVLGWMFSGISNGMPRSLGRPAAAPGRADGPRLLTAHEAGCQPRRHLSSSGTRGAARADDVEEAVDLVGEPAQLHGYTGLCELARVGLALVTQRIEAGRRDVRRSQARGHVPEEGARLGGRPARLIREVVGL